MVFVYLTLQDGDRPFELASWSLRTTVQVVDVYCLCVDVAAVTVLFL